jgi:GR25 family glycosyltransferase involved in LPS biosynthesis
MNVYYPNRSTWEMDYFVEIFSSSPQFEIVYYDQLPTEIVNGSILTVTFLNRDNIEDIKKLKPVCLVILSDEAGDLDHWNEHGLKIFRNYNYVHSNLKDIIHIPLGYAKGMLGGKPSTEIKIKKIKDREYKYAFIGAMKQNRREMAETFLKHFKNGYIKDGPNNWNINQQIISPQEMFKIYNNSVFVPNGRGNCSLDCFRIYEAIVSGAIPVLVGSESEISAVLTINGKIIPCIYSDTWENAAQKCKSYTLDELQTIQNKLIDWWKWQLEFVQSEFLKLLKVKSETVSFVINLKRRPDRLQQFHERCPYNNIETVYGFDGNNANQENKKERKIFEHLSMLRPGERGCWISHLRIWKKIVDQGIPSAIIFEDDAEFHENFVEIITQTVFPTDGIVYIGGRFTKNFVMSTEYTLPVAQYICQSNMKKFLNTVHERTTHAYVITLKLAKLFLEIFNTVPNPGQLDHFMIQKLKALDIPVYSTIPLLCHSPMVGDSDIR